MSVPIRRGGEEAMSMTSDQILAHMRAHFPPGSLIWVSIPQRLTVQQLNALGESIRDNPRFSEWQFFLTSGVEKLEEIGQVPTDEELVDDLCKVRRAPCASNGLDLLKGKYLFVKRSA
jgi:hypothetical protein